MRNWLVQGLTPILCGLAVLISAIALGRASRASLHDRAAYRLCFTDIHCQPPEGMSRAVFLNEVRSLACLPAALDLLDDDLTDRLPRAFLAHPWVESVRRVAIVSSGSHAKTSVRVELEYRRAVLAVPLSTEDRSGKRLVDRYGILLPETAVPAHVPVFMGNVAAPTGPSGSRWGDARIAAAAKTAAFLQSHLAKLGLEDCQIEVNNGEIVFRRCGVRIVWGHAPGQEKENEAPAQVKLRRLLDYQKEHDGLDSLEHDVRFLAYQGHFPLTPGATQTTISLYERSQPPSRRNRYQVSNSSGNWQSCFNDAKPPSDSASSR
ncbi:MAG: cell division protein FtsQ/DivIB [Gemmataceae bacterium]